MTIKKVPARTEVLCDVCGDDCSMSRKKGRLIVKRNALDRYGDAAADGSVEYDLCDKCLGRIGKVINAEADAIKAERDG